VFEEEGKRVMEGRKKEEEGHCYMRGTLKDALARATKRHSNTKLCNGQEGKADLISKREASTISVIPTISSINAFGSVRNIEWAFLP
jgi:hypothetical protein